MLKSLTQTAGSSKKKYSSAITETVFGPLCWITNCREKIYSALTPFTFGWRKPEADKLISRQFELAVSINLGRAEIAFEHTSFRMH